MFKSYINTSTSTLYYSVLPRQTSLLITLNPCINNSSSPIMAPTTDNDQVSDGRSPDQPHGVGQARVSLLTTALKADANYEDPTSKEDTLKGGNLTYDSSQNTLSRKIPSKPTCPRLAPSRKTIPRTDPIRPGKPASVAVLHLPTSSLPVHNTPLTTTITSLFLIQALRVKPCSAKGAKAFPQAFLPQS